MNIMRTGIGFDAHRLVEGRQLILGGVQIDSPRGLEGHSDADVLVHAIIDALLGAVALGDIGTHFPDSDEKWKGARSMDLLRHVAGMMNSRSERIVNVDSTIIAESPPLAAYIFEMRSNLSEVLDIPFDRVSVKATTVEGLGALGRKEGIAAMSVSTVDQVL